MFLKIIEQHYRHHTAVLETLEQGQEHISHSWGGFWERFRKQGYNGVILVFGKLVSLFRVLEEFKYLGLGYSPGIESEGLE